MKKAFFCFVVLFLFTASAFAQFDFLNQVQEQAKQTVKQKVTEKVKETTGTKSETKSTGSSSDYMDEHLYKLKYHPTEGDSMYTPAPDAAPPLKQGKLGNLQYYAARDKGPILAEKYNGLDAGMAPFDKPSSLFYYYSGDSVDLKIVFVSIGYTGVLTVTDSTGGLIKKVSMKPHSFKSVNLLLASARLAYATKRGMQGKSDNLDKIGWIVRITGPGFSAKIDPNMKPDQTPDEKWPSFYVHEPEFISPRTQLLINPAPNRWSGIFYMNKIYEDNTINGGTREAAKYYLVSDQYFSLGKDSPNVIKVVDKPVIENLRYDFGVIRFDKNYQQVNKEQTGKYYGYEAK